MKSNSSKQVIIDGFVITQSTHNTITASEIFGITKKDNTHLGHDDITWIVKSDVICNDCNSCNGCQGSCHSSCQGSCTSGCNSSCYSCQGSCTSSCQGCTSRCQNTNGCSSCNSCQTCVGVACNSCNGQCTSIVYCHPNIYTCQGCHNRCVGVAGKASCSSCNSCTSCVTCQSDTQQTAPVVPVKNPPNVKEIVCDCYGCQNTVSGGNGCGNNYGYGGTDKITIVFDDGHTVETYIKGEDIVAGGGTQRNLDQLANDFVGMELAGAKVTQNTVLINVDGSGNIQSQKKISEFQGHCSPCAAVTSCSGTYCPGSYIDTSYVGPSPTGSSCNGNQNAGCGSVTGCSAGCTSGWYGPGGPGYWG